MDSRHTARRLALGAAKGPDKLGPTEQAVMHALYDYCLGQKEARLDDPDWSNWEQNEHESARFVHVTSNQNLHLSARWSLNMRREYLHDQEGHGLATTSWATHRWAAYPSLRFGAGRERMT